MTRRTPRPYQIQAVNSIFDYFAVKDGNPLVAMPTGTGKSVVIAALLEAIYWHWKNQRVMMLTHVKELIQQNYEKLLSQWPSAPVGINSAGLGKRDFHHPIIFAGIASVAKHWAKFGHIDLILIDEAHLVSPSEETMYQAFISGLRSINPKLKVIGFTATPWRLGQGLITDAGLFTDICFDITGEDAFNRLIAEGYLSPLIPKRTTYMLDTDGVHMRGGEFIPGELQNAVDKDEITEQACLEAIDKANDRNHWLVFCAGVEHAIHTAQMLNQLGISAIAIHSEMGDKERDAAIRDWKAGKYGAATNNNVLTTGLDFPAIDLILMLRPTQSTVLWVQMLGRGTRPSPETGKQNCLVLDFAGNTKRLGQVNNPRIPRKKGEAAGDAPVKCCEVCDTWQHAARTHCENCGAEFPPPMTKLKAQASTDALISGELPVTEMFKVDYLTYAEHIKQGVPPMLKVSYYCGLKLFTRYVCIEHNNFAQRKAKQWWREHTTQPFPASTADALEVCADYLKPATHLNVWTNKKPYPEILAECFDGSAFGTIAPTDEVPTIDVQGTRAAMSVEETARRSDPANRVPGFDDLDDDIPF